MLLKKSLMIQNSKRSCATAHSEVLKGGSKSSVERIWSYALMFPFKVFLVVSSVMVVLGFLECLEKKSGEKCQDHDIRRI